MEDIERGRNVIETHKPEGVAAEDHQYEGSSNQSAEGWERKEDARSIEHFINFEVEEQPITSHASRSCMSESNTSLSSSGHQVRSSQFPSYVR